MQEGNNLTVAVKYANIRIQLLENAIHYTTSKFRDLGLGMSAIILE